MVGLQRIGNGAEPLLIGQAAQVAANLGGNGRLVAGGGAQLDVDLVGHLIPSLQHALAQSIEAVDALGHAGFSSLPTLDILLHGVERGVGVDAPHAVDQVHALLHGVGANARSNWRATSLRLLPCAEKFSMNNASLTSWNGSR